MRSILLILSVSISQSNAEPFPVALTTGNNYPPFTGLELSYGGMATTLVIKAFEKSGYFVKEVDWLPWKRGYSMAKVGEYHGTFPYGWTK